METYTALFAIFVLGAVQRFVYGFDHRWMRSRYDALVRSIAESRSAGTRDPSVMIGSGGMLPSGEPSALSSFVSYCG